LRVTVRDPDGGRADLGRVRLDGLPGPASTPAYWAQEVRLPLRTAQPISAVELRPLGGAGRAWLLDAWVWRPGLPAVRVVSPPRVDLGEATVDEGAAGARTRRIPVTVSGRGVGEVRFFLTEQSVVAPSRTRSWVARLRPGHRDLGVPVRVRGDRAYGGGVRHLLRAKAVRGVLVGDFSGELTVRDDDPFPGALTASRHPGAGSGAGRPPSPSPPG
jgi:hypothetical protein